MPKSALHNLSHSVKMSSKMGQLMPISVFDVVPGDNIDHRITALLRTQPLLAPVMHAVDVDLHVFFTPDRLLWDESEQFYTGGDDGLDTTVAPYMVSPASTGYVKGSLADYLGLPLGVPDLQHSALPFRAYASIFNHYYRDSQIVSEVAMSTASGLDTTTNRNLLYPAWRRDYFTTCRPEPQLGPDVVVPLTGDAPIKGFGLLTGSNANAGPVSSKESDGSTEVYAEYFSQANNLAVKSQDISGTDYPDIVADLSSVSAIGIRELRESSAIQRFLEFNNIWGGRYMEQLLARFGVRPQDYRLQWPEFLGAGSTKIQFSEVLQTAEGTDPVGQMAGHGISIVGSNRYRRKIPEHGWIMVFMIVRPKTQYMQGQHRMWNRVSRFDYLTPEFVGIGDQPVLIKELYADAADPDLLFGYNQMYDEYRHIPSRVAGDFRDTLKYWHMAREFASEPALNATFITCNPTTRIFPDTTSDNLYIDCEHKILARRPLPKTAPYRLM